LRYRHQTVTRRRRRFRRLSHRSRMFQLFDRFRRLENVEARDVCLNDDVVDAVVKQYRRRYRRCRRFKSFFFPLRLVLDILRQMLKNFLRQ
jgi:hypothetical protein